MIKSIKTSDFEKNFLGMYEGCSMIMRKKKEKKNKKKKTEKFYLSSKCLQVYNTRNIGYSQLFMHVIIDYNIAIIT